MSDNIIVNDATKSHEKLEKAFIETGLDICVNRVGSLLSVFFTNEKVTDYKTAMTSDTVKFSKYFGYMLENGIYAAPSQFEAMFLSAAHSDEDIERTVEVIKGIVNLKL